MKDNVKRERDRRARRRVMMSQKEWGEGKRRQKNDRERASWNNLKVSSSEDLLHDFPSFSESYLIFMVWGSKLGPKIN